MSNAILKILDISKYLIIDNKNLKCKLDNIWNALSKYSIKILDILKQD